MVRSFIMVATLIQLARPACFPRKVSRPPSAALFDNSPARRRRFRLHRSWSGVPISPRAIELAQPGDTICLEGILECGAVVDRTSLTITGSAALDCLHSGTGLVVEFSGLVLSGMTHQSAVADNYSAVYRSGNRQCVRGAVKVTGPPTPEATVYKQTSIHQLLQHL